MGGAGSWQGVVLLVEGVVPQYRVRKSTHCVLTCYWLIIMLTFFIFFFLTEKNEAENLEENEEPFIAPLGLSVPSDVELVRVLLHWPPCGWLLFSVVHEDVA